MGEKREAVFGIPGWTDRAEFVRSVVQSSGGDFMFAGRILANPKRQEHVELEFCEADPRMHEAFEAAGQGRIAAATLDQIGEHRGVVYLVREIPLVADLEKLLIFTRAVRECGGFAIKVESAGVAHEWAKWDECLSSDLGSLLYQAFICLVADEKSFYSCGMHHFGCPDAEVPKDLGLQSGAMLLNQFNVYQIVEEPLIKEGQTFSLAEDSERFRLQKIRDGRHAADDLFHNPHGLWSLRHLE